MLGKVKAVTLLSVVGAAVLIPLYGDARSSPVTHAEWARMMLRALTLDGVVENTASASQAFSTLSWKNSLAYPADRYLQADGVEILGDGRVAARSGTGETTYPVAVVRGGDYRLRLRLAGDPKKPVTAEVRPFGKSEAARQFLVEASAEPAWVRAGSLHLDPGAYTASVVLPAGTVLEYLELAPPCLRPVEPLGGWRSLAVTQADDVAVTVLKALDLESELPPAAVPLEPPLEAFQTRGPQMLAAGVGRFKLSAGPLGLQAVAFVEIEEPGLYTVSVFGLIGAGQGWLADECQKAVLCPTDPLAPPQWRVVMNTQFTSGRHFFTVNLARGATVERLHVERKKDESADYVATLRRLGFEVGTEGPVARSRAVDAMNFLTEKRRELQWSACGDVHRPPETLMVAAGVAQPAPPGTGSASAPQRDPGFSGENPSGGPGGDPPTVPGTVPTPVPTAPPGSPTTLTARPRS